MEKVKQVLRHRGYKKITIAANASQALAHLQSSHDALFVFQKKKFLGVVNLYYSFLRHHPQPQEKIERLLYHPPCLAPHNSLIRAAKLMAEARLYWLPVVENGKFLGVISATDILRRLAYSAAASRPLAAIKLSPAIYLDEKATLAQARQLMLKHRASRLIVLQHRKPVGILSSYDLRQKQLTPSWSRLRLGNHINKENMPVKLFYHHGLVTTNDQTTIRQALRQLLASKTKSLVILQGENIIGLVSYRNLLKYFTQPNFYPFWNISFRLRLPLEEKIFLGNYFQRLFQRKPILREKIQRLDLIFSRQTQRPNTKTYQVTTRVWATGQRAFTLVIKGGHFRHLLSKVSRQIRRQLK